jgi:hypothetical protein
MALIPVSTTAQANSAEHSSQYPAQMVGGYMPGSSSPSHAAQKMTRGAAAR